VRTDVAEAAVLDYLYRFFLDRPAFDAAVKAATPSADGRKQAERELRDAEKTLEATDKEIQRLAMAVAQGADVGLVLGAQGELKRRREEAARQVEALRTKVDSLPDARQTKRAAMAARLFLLDQHRGKNWHTLPYDAVQQFMRSLFGDDPKRCGWGVFITKVEGRFIATFKGAINFDCEVHNGRPCSKGFLAAVDAANAALESYQKAALAKTAVQCYVDRKEFADRLRAARRILGRGQNGRAERLNHRDSEGCEPLYVNWWA
jgi:hypothetical protein